MLPPPFGVDPSITVWHITVVTYGARLHGDELITVDRSANRVGDPFVTRDPQRELTARLAMRYEEVSLTSQQRAAVETELPSICQRGGWSYQIAAALSEHFHLLCGVPRIIQGKRVRGLAKRWLPQSLNARWPRPVGGPWWVDQGSARAVKEERYFKNVNRYILRQHTLLTEA